MKRKQIFSLFTLISLGLLSASIASAQSFLADKAVRTQVLRVKSSPSDIEQAAAAEELFDLVKGRNLNRVRPQTIRMISTLLDTNFDGVRLWIAATLGEFGVRASFTAPRLIAIFKQVECRHVDASSAFTIQTALKKMGENIPNTECSK